MSENGVHLLPSAMGKMRFQYIGIWGVSCWQTLPRRFQAATPLSLLTTPSASPEKRASFGPRAAKEVVIWARRFWSGRWVIQQKQLWLVDKPVASSSRWAINPFLAPDTGTPFEAMCKPVKSAQGTEGGSWNWVPANTPELQVSPATWVWVVNPTWSVNQSSQECVCVYCIYIYIHVYIYIYICIYMYIYTYKYTYIYIYTYVYVWYLYYIKLYHIVIYYIILYYIMI